MPRRILRIVGGLVVAAALLAPTAAAPVDPFPLDRAGEQWVARTFKQLSLDEKIGQLIVPTFESGYLSADSDEVDRLAGLVRDLHVGGFCVFGASEPAPAVLLNPAYGTVTLGQPLAAAWLLNRLQRMSAVPLLNAADLETGAAFRFEGATRFPRQMALGATGDPRLVREAARVTGVEARAIGLQIAFAPVADVNNNARNPVINTRSFGEDPARVAAFVGAFVDGAREARLMATLKHFPGHGDTDVDTHLGLATVPYGRDRLDRVELVPFRFGIDRGAAGVMTSHIELPALDPAPDAPATFSRPIVEGLLRHDLGFEGLVYTDSMSMAAIAGLMPPAEAAVRAVLAGADQILQPPDPAAAAAGLKSAVADGRLPQSRIDASVRRILRAKAFAGLDRAATVDLEAVPGTVGGRAHEALAREASQRSITLVKDDRHQVPLAAPRDAPILYLSVLDYPAGWRVAAPSRTFLPELKQRWPAVTAFELSDRTSLSDLDVVRAVAPRYAAVVAGIFVRATAGSGRLDLAPQIVRLLADLAREAGRNGTPMVACFFGNPYAAASVPELPAVLLTYDLYDLAEASAVRAIAGEAPIGGRLPITLPGLFPAGFGLDRPAGPPAP